MMCSVVGVMCCVVPDHVLVCVEHDVSRVRRCAVYVVCCAVCVWRGHDVFVVCRVLWFLGSLVSLCRVLDVWCFLPCARCVARLRALCWALCFVMCIVYCCLLWCVFALGRSFFYLFRSDADTERSLVERWDHGCIFSLVCRPEISRAPQTFETASFGKYCISLSARSSLTSVDHFFPPHACRSV